jgi:uncharacterized protein YbbK (DUF523 family)
MDKDERSPSCGHGRAKHDSQARCGGQEKIEGYVKKVLCVKRISREII